MERLTRVRTISVPKETGFICGKCNATGDCANNEVEAVKKNLAFFWDEKAGERGKIVCLGCHHWLETAKELETELKVNEIQRYGFWLRFLTEHFIPCAHCQERIHKVLTSKEMHIGNDEKPLVELWRDWDGITIIEKENTVFCKEWCVLCGNQFDADFDYIYECEEYKRCVCYECGDRITNKSKKSGPRPKP